ncbi:MAG: hypothetical protein QNJ13_03825 [Paracoccaceae bacterium]|nr:hypothetical protein [Paracoccaceae bacterium]
MVWGWYISGAAHGVLLVILLVGGVFARPPEAPVSVADVEILSEAEFAALVLRNPAPEVAEEPSAPLPPAPEEAPEAPEPDSPLPQITESPAPEAEAPAPSPEVTIPTPTPEAEVDDTPPVVAAPDPLPEGPRFEAPPQRAPRVAPTPAPAPPDTAEIAPDTAPAIAPAPDAPPVETVEETPETAPEEAAPELATEADEPTESLALATSPRPQARPSRPVPQPEAPATATATAEPAAPATDDAVAAALADDTPRGDPGPPLTGAERDNLRVAVRDCWNVGSLSTAAKETIVTVFVALDRNGRPDIASIRLLGFQNGTEATAARAFEAARRAIIRCGSRGFPLPVEKYEQWREIEMTFNLDGVSF